MRDVPAAASIDAAVDCGGRCAVRLVAVLAAVLVAVVVAASAASADAHAATKLLLAQSPDRYEQGSGYSNLAIADLERGTTTVLAACSPTMARPAPSPDGTKILFTAVEMSAPGMNGSPSLQVYDTKTSACSPFPTPTTYAANPAWSADGSTVAWDTSRSTRGSLDFWYGTGDVWVASADGSQPHKIASNASNPALSPDGETVVFSAAVNPGEQINYWDQYELRAAPTSGAGPMRTVYRDSDPNRGAFTPSFSADGSRIAFTSTVNGRGGGALWVVNSDGSNAHEIYQAPGVDALDPVFGPDANHITFAHRASSLWPDYLGQIAKIRLDGADLQIIHTPTVSTTWEYSPRWLATDSSPPVLTPRVSGREGRAGWYAGDASVTWDVSDPESSVTSTSGCDQVSVTDDTAGRVITCVATSSGGSASSSLTIKRDASAPTVAVGGGGNYSLNQSVNITCDADDATSGIANSSCDGITGTKEAWRYAAGRNPITASAEDNAGNESVGEITVTVTATPSTLCTLSKTFVQGSDRYPGLRPAQKAATDALATTLCRQLDALSGQLTATQKSKMVAAYKTTVDALVPSGWLTAGQSSTLKRWADSL